MNKWIAEFELEDGDIMPEHMDINYKGAKIDFHCKPLEQEPTTKDDLPHCQCTDAEIAKSFVEDVEAVKDQLPCGEQMDFPSTFDEFANEYGFKDKNEVYTNGSELIPVFRVKQWLEHIKSSTTKNNLGIESEEQAEKELAVKTNLEVDCISSKIAKEMHLEVANMKKIVQALSSVASQLSSELDKNSKKLEKDFGESDCISRADVNQVIEDYMDEQYHVLSDRARERAFGANAVRARINELDPVTPQKPRKGHWVLTDVEGNRVWHCHCSECGKDPQDYIGGSENWWLIKNKLPKYCPYCGSDNREVEE